MRSDWDIENFDINCVRLLVRRLSSAARISPQTITSDVALPPLSALHLHNVLSLVGHVSQNRWQRLLCVMEVLGVLTVRTLMLSLGDPLSTSRKM
jgi:hypothetical protein